jgi:hypothetical protein
MFRFTFQNPSGACSRDQPYSSGKEEEADEYLQHAAQQFSPDVKPGSEEYP